MTLPFLSRTAILFFVMGMVGVFAMGPVSGPVAVPSNEATAASASGVQANSGITVAVTEQGYEPASITVKKDVPTKITFIRKTDKTCGTEISIPEYKISKPLPLNEPVVVELTPTKSGEFKITCGMNMLDGKLVVQ